MKTNFIYIRCEHESYKTLVNLLSSLREFLDLHVESGVISNYELNFNSRDVNDSLWKS